MIMSFIIFVAPSQDKIIYAAPATKEGKFKICD
jgi:hypothetical protein